MNILDYQQQADIYSGLSEVIHLQTSAEIIKLTGAKFGVDGNQYFYISGELQNQDCIAGFGDTPRAALSDFTSKFYSQKVVIFSKNQNPLN